MTLIARFIKAHKQHKDWSYRELAEYLGTSTAQLRGYNARLKPPLPIPVKYKAPNGQARTKRQRRLDKLNHTITVPEPIPVRVNKAVRKALFTPPAQTGSGRKQYGSYLKLL